MTRETWQHWQVQAVAELTVMIGVVAACALVGLSRATHHRVVNPKPPVHGPREAPRSHPAALDADERAAVLTLLDSERYADVSVAQVYARELDEGRYWCSPRTMYRILADAGQGGERRRQQTHPPKTIPELVAHQVGDVWSWDITKMRGPGKGCWYHAYVILDIFSRYVVGWRIENVEDGRLAADLVEQIVTETGHRPGWLHADGGAAMTSKPLASLLSDLDITPSRSRPHTSNDNPYSEAQFKTMKYVSDYPDRFESIGHARAWMDGFVTYYNHEHYHSGIGYYTPASVHHGTADTVRELRQTTLDTAYTEHPERFNHRPQATKLPTIAHINDPARRRPEQAKPEPTPTSHLI